MSKALLPKISLITPSFNQGEYIEETILSVINQQYPNFEYIIIDGGSTDATIDIIHKYTSHITYWISEPDKGQSDAINKGFKVATGDIINWLNSDDCLAPGALHKVAESFAQSAITAVTTGVQNFEENGVRWNEITPVKKSAVEYLGKVLNNQPGTYFKKEEWNKYFPIPAQLHYVMDQYLWFCYWLNNKADNFKTNEQVTVYFRRHAQSKTNLSLKSELFRQMGKSFFNEYNLLFWSYFNAIDKQKAGVIECYFDKDYTYRQKELKFPVAGDPPSADILFNTYLFELLKEDYRCGYLDRLISNIPYLNKTLLNADDANAFKKMRRAKLSKAMLKTYRAIYWKVKGLGRHN